MANKVHMTPSVYAASGGGGVDSLDVVVVAKPSDTSRTGTTQTDDTHLTINMNNNTSYRVVATLLVTCASDVPDFEFAIVATATNLTYGGFGAVMTHSKDIANRGGGNVNGLTTWIRHPGTGMALVTIEGTYLYSDTGVKTFTLQWAQRTNDANPIVLKAGSTMQVQATS